MINVNCTGVVMVTKQGDVNVGVCSGPPFVPRVHPDVVGDEACGVVWCGVVWCGVVWCGVV